VRELKLIAMDTSKHVFTLHGVDERGQVVLRRELRRGQDEAFFRKLPPTEVALEACGGSHHWVVSWEHWGTECGWSHRNTLRLCPAR
jgi:transposase